MKKLFVIIAAGSALVTGTAASAQYAGQYGGGYRQGNDWNVQNRGYSRFEQQYRHTIQGIQHGMNDGTYSRSRANDFFRELQSIRREAFRAQQYGNYQDGYVQARLSRLHERMHRKHDRNHARNEGYGQYDQGYGGTQPGYDGGNHGHDGHDDDDD